MTSTSGWSDRSDTRTEAPHKSAVRRHDNVVPVLWPPFRERPSAYCAHRRCRDGRTPGHTRCAAGTVGDGLSQHGIEPPPTTPIAPCDPNSPRPLGPQGLGIGEGSAHHIAQESFCGPGKRILGLGLSLASQLRRLSAMGSRRGQPAISRDSLCHLSAIPTAEEVQKVVWYGPPA